MSLNPLFLPSLPCCLPAEKTIPDWPPIDYIFESLYDNLQVADYHLVAQIADFIQNAPNMHVGHPSIQMAILCPIMAKFHPKTYDSKLVNYVTIFKIINFAEFSATPIIMVVVKTASRGKFLLTCRTLM
jgi:hypothetical protein